MCIGQIVCVDSSVDGHVGCSHILAVVSNTAADVGVWLCPQDPDFTSSGRIPRSGIAASDGSSSFHSSRSPSPDSVSPRLGVAIREGGRRRAFLIGLVVKVDGVSSHPDSHPCGLHSMTPFVPVTETLHQREGCVQARGSVVGEPALNSGPAPGSSLGHEAGGSADTGDPGTAGCGQRCGLTQQREGAQRRVSVTSSSLLRDGGTESTQVQAEGPGAVL